MQQSTLADDQASLSAIVLNNDVRRLAEGTELLGEYQDSGYQTPKYLVRRADGQVLQLPQLLYRVAASLDGRDTGQIAADLNTQLVRGELSAEQVLYLVDERLRPVGLVAPDGADADDSGRAAAPVRSDPLLALRYRVGVVPERVTWRIAGVFGLFFTRPVWVAAVSTFIGLDVCILLQGDLMGRLTAGVTSLVHRPQLTLLLLALVLLSAAFHECGHVAACRFGGARPGAMGIGLYLVWPAFYSTVTDSYRLNRIGRLRTDLGGVYFNAIFMTVASLAYLQTGETWLLVAIFLMHFETAFQFLPLLRFDGYYMLADLVGVPELFNFVGPALTSLVPGRGMHPRLRELQPRARRLIGLWVGLAVPMLLYYLVVFLLVLPRVLPVAWAALLQRVSATQAAVRAGDVTTGTLGVYQLILLLLPWVGSALITAMLIGMLRRAAVSRGWAWAAPGRWAAVRSYAMRVGVGVLGAALVLRVTQVAMSAPLSSAETRISSSALGVPHLGRAAAPAVGPGEGLVRDQLALYAGLTGAFDRHADVLSGGRELAVLAVLVLVSCLLVVATLYRWRPLVVAIPLLAVTVMGPAVTALATVGPAVVGAAWVAAGATLMLAAHHHRGRRRTGPVPARHYLPTAMGVAGVAVGIATAPLLAVPLAVGGALLVVRRAARPHPLPHRAPPARWAPLALALFGVTTLTALTAPALLRAPSATVLTSPEKQVLVVTTLLVVGAALAMSELRSLSVVLGSLALLAALPTSGAAAVLPLAVCAAVTLAALALNTLTRRPPPQRPHPLLRAAVMVPALTLVVVGGLFAPTNNTMSNAASNPTGNPTGHPAAVPVLRPQVLAEVPHDPSAFTQGLELNDGTLYEGTGLQGQSQLRELDPATGAVRRAVPLPGELFGEGITVVGNRIWQLTWRDGVVLEWDRATLKLRRQLPLNGEGWGLCYDGNRLVRSDGTDRLYFHDPVTFAETGGVAVTVKGAPLTQLNELECVGGQVWANVWQTDELVRIDPANGHVTAVVSAPGLLDPQRRANPDAVLNGIAAVGNDEYLLTGKLWPVSFRVRFAPV